MSETLGIAFESCGTCGYQWVQLDSTPAFLVPVLSRPMHRWFAHAAQDFACRFDTCACSCLVSQVLPARIHTHWALPDRQLSGPNGVYTAPILPAGYTGGSGRQLFRYSPLAPGTAAVTFAYGCALGPLPSSTCRTGPPHHPHTLLRPAEARTLMIRVSAVTDHMARALRSPPPSILRGGAAPAVEHHTVAVGRRSDLPLTLAKRVAQAALDPRRVRCAGRRQHHHRPVTAQLRLGVTAALNWRPHTGAQSTGARHTDAARSLLAELAEPAKLVRRLRDPPRSLP